MVTIADLDAIIAKFVSRGFNDIVASMDHNDVCDAIKVIRDLIAGGGMTRGFADYTGDGTTSRLINLGITPKIYVIFHLEEGYYYFQNAIFFDSTGWTLYHQSTYPYAIPTSYVSGTSVDVGAIYDYLGIANESGFNYRIIGYA